MAAIITIWITLAAACAAVNAGVTDIQQPQLLVETSEPSVAGETWPEVMFFPDDDGQPQPGRIYGKAFFWPATRKDVVFTLYTSRRPETGETLEIDDAKQLKRSTFNRRRPTVLVTHGFLSSARSKYVQKIKDAYLKNDEVNVVTVDWSRKSRNPLYFVVKKETIPVGGIVADFVDFLRKKGHADPDKIHLIGHSLGAHIMGIAAKKSKRKVGRVTGLDPARPLFDLSDKATRLDGDDAKFVDVIHTCGGKLGIKEPIGQVDFFPNGGEAVQPGCRMDQVFGGICSHSRAWELYAESINSKYFWSMPCPSYQHFEHHHEKCKKRLSAPMGKLAPSSITGKYYLDTADSSPYALGYSSS